MTRLPLPGYWYGEACLRADGSRGYWASPITGTGIMTEHGPVTTDVPLGWTRGHPSGWFAGQVMNSAAGNKAYHESSGDGVIVGPSYGNSPVLYLRDGTLVQSIVGQASGLRYQADDGSVVTCDQTHVSPDGLLAEYTELQGVRVGQDQIAGLGCIIQIVATGQRFILERSANCIAIRMNAYAPNRLAIYVVKLAEKEAVCVWLTTDEIATLEPYPAPPVVIGPTTPPRAADGRVYDLRPFLASDPALQPRIGTSGQPTDTQYETPLVDGVFYYVKFGNPEAYEARSLDPNWLCLLEDGSANPPQHFSDPRWYPTEMAIGETHAFVTGPHEVVSLARVGCGETARTPINRKMWPVALYDGWQWGKDLGIRATLVLAYDPTDGFHAPDRFIELWYFAWEAGACRFEAHRSDMVYASGQAVFSDASRTSRTDFYLVGGPVVAAALTHCVPYVAPSLPPWNPTPPVPPEGGFVIDPKEVIVYASQHPSTQAGCVNLILPDGSVFSCQSDGSPGTRPAGTDGPWEQAQVTGSLATFNSNGHFFAFGIAPMDKLAR